MKRVSKDKEGNRLQRQARYWDEYWDKIAGEVLSAGLGGAPEYWNYEDNLQKRALIQALKALNVDLRGKNILDVGCGNGRLSFWFAEHGAYVCGIDISPQAISKAITIRRKNNLNRLDFLLYDGLSFPFRNGSFDMVNMAEILPLIEKIGLTERVISEVIRVCKAGGLILVIGRIKNYPEDEYRKIVPEDRLVHLFETNGAKLVLSRGIYVDRVRFYFHYLSHFKVTWKVLKHFIPVVLKWSELIDKHLISFLSKYAEKSYLFLGKCGRNVHF
jgi:SAM-dependent methyltransferase